MRVVCPACKLDAGEVPGAEPGVRIECPCGHRWILVRAMSARKPSSPPPAPAPAVLQKSAAMIAGGLQRLAGGVKASLSRYTFSKKIPTIFLDAAADGVITEEEEAQIRRALAEHGITWEEAAEQVRPMATEFLRRVLADVVADGQVTAEERKEITRYIELFGLQALRVEIHSVLNRVETIWKLQNGQLPQPVLERPMWLKSDEAVYHHRAGQYLKKMREAFVSIPGDFYLTNSRFQFISQDASVDRSYDQIRECQATRRTHLSLTFHPRSGSGVYVLDDAPLAAAYVDCLARAANRTITIEREDSTVDARRRIPQESRHEVWIRDGGKCVECGAEDYLEYDHIIPVTRGGSNAAQNVQLLCRRCNGKKSDRI